MIQPLEGKALHSFELSDRRLNLWEGAVRSAKTVSSLLRWMQFVRHGPSGNLLMAGRTERTLERNVIHPLQEMVGSDRCKLIRGSGEAWLLGRRVYIAGGNDERAQEKVRGLTLAGAYIDEVSTVPESFFRMILSRMSVEDASLFGTSNPDNPNHWLKTGFLDRASLWLTQQGDVLEGDQASEAKTRGDDGAELLDLARLSFRLTDNPTLAQSYVDAITSEYTGLWRKRFIDGLWVVAEGTVYEAWDPDVHVVDLLPPMRRWVVGVDYGARNPFAALLLGQDKAGAWWVVREYRYDGRNQPTATLSKHAKAVTDLARDPVETMEGVQRPAPSAVLVDPSAAGLIDQLRTDGLSQTRAANNEVLQGIQTVSTALANRRLYVHESCVGLIGEMPGYVWDDKAAERGDDQPVKVNDHSLDALRYALSEPRQGRSYRR